MKSWLDRLFSFGHALLLSAVLGRALGILWRFGVPSYGLGLLSMWMLWKVLLYRDHTDPERMARILVADYWRRHPKV